MGGDQIPVSHKWKQESHLEGMAVGQEKLIDWGGMKKGLVERLYIQVYILH
jgi:hypothetical protein